MNDPKPNIPSSVNETTAKPAEAASAVEKPEVAKIDTRPGVERSPWKKQRAIELGILKP